MLPVPTLDHVVINTRDQMDLAVETYRRLGFTLTPRGYHTLGSMNHLAIFGTDYLELIAIDPNAETPRAAGGIFPPGRTARRHSRCRLSHRPPRRRQTSRTDTEIRITSATTARHWQ